MNEAERKEWSHNHMSQPGFLMNTVLILLQPMRNNTISNNIYFAKFYPVFTKGQFRQRHSKSALSAESFWQ